MATAGDTPSQCSHGPNSWDALTRDYDSGLWIHAFCQLPFLRAQLTKLAAEHGGTPWKALDVGCGMGKYTRLMLQAGASYVLAFDNSKDMVEGAKLAIDKFRHSQAQLESRADFAIASATEVSSIPGADEGTFDLAMCVYLFCNLRSEEEVKQALREIYKMLKPGGKLIIYEAHVMYYMQWLDKSKIPLLDIWATPKEDATNWGYFEDEGNPREITMTMNSGQAIKFTNRFYTLSSWVSWILEAGFQITQFSEPHVDPKVIPSDAPDYAKFIAGKPLEMCWECTKPLEQLY